MDFNFDKFSSMITNLGTTSAKIEKDETKLDTKKELNVFTSGFDAIQNKAKSEGAEETDISKLESAMKTEMSSILGVDFGKSAGLQEQTEDNTKPAFSEEEISLENMMSMLSAEDGIDMDKLREYNKKPLVSSAESQKAIETLKEFGFDTELAETILEETPGAITYISDAIKNGSAKRIGNDTNNINDKLYELSKANLHQRAVDAMIHFGLQ